eukprot:1161318-Pelagomonas_calceolata.AAC.7
MADIQTQHGQPASKSKMTGGTARAHEGEGQITEGAQHGHMTGEGQIAEMETEHGHTTVGGQITEMMPEHGHTSVGGQITEMIQHST